MPKNASGRAAAALGLTCTSVTPRTPRHHSRNVAESHTAKSQTEKKTREKKKKDFFSRSRGVRGAARAAPGSARGELRRPHTRQTCRAKTTHGSPIRSSVKCDLFWLWKRCVGLTTVRRPTEHGDNTRSDDESGRGAERGGPEAARDAAGRRLPARRQRTRHDGACDVSGAAPCVRRNC